MILDHFFPEKTPEQKLFQESCQAILLGHAKEGLRLKGTLDLSNNQSLWWLPADLKVDVLNVSQCPNLKELPAGLKVKVLLAANCASLSKLPSDLSCQSLYINNCPIEEIPLGLTATKLIDASGCRGLVKLPSGLRTQSLILDGCTSLEQLPDKLTLRHLNIANCLSISELPPNMVLSGSIELAGSGLTGLPHSMSKLVIYWRRFQISRRVAFNPEQIKLKDLLKERNVEKRRILLERMGYERFLQEASPQLVDEDRDRGGIRQLLRIEVEQDEDLYLLRLTCPSTSHRYILRVPPNMCSCHQAAAWVAGFDNSDDYNPVVET